MKNSVGYLFLFVAGLLNAAGALDAKEPAPLLHAHLQGFQEVPVVSTVATGEFRGVINPGDTSINYEFSYTGLQGNVTQAHIHIGQRNVSGGIVIWLCQTAANPLRLGFLPFRSARLARVSLAEPSRLRMSLPRRDLRTVANRSLPVISPRFLPRFEPARPMQTYIQIFHQAAKSADRSKSCAMVEIS